jgi:hypothetical protein
MDLINLPIEIYSVIGTYLDYHDIIHLLDLLHVDNSKFWSTYLQIKHPQLLGYQLLGNPIGYDNILSYYETADFYKLTPENKIYDNILQTNRPEMKQMISVLFSGSKYHLNQIEGLYKDYPVEFETLLKYGLLKNEDHGYFVTILNNPELIKKYYLKSSLPRFTIDEYNPDIKNAKEVKSIIEARLRLIDVILAESISEIVRVRTNKLMNESLQFVYVTDFSINYMQNVVNAMEYFNVNKF